MPAVHENGSPADSILRGLAPPPDDREAAIMPVLRDAMWRLRASLPRGEHAPRAVQFAGVAGREGATTLALHYAAAAADLGQARTLIIDADLETRALSARLGAAGRRGLTDWRPGEPLALANTWINNLKLLPAGTMNGESLAVIAATGRLASLMNRLRGDFDDIVFDSRPLGGMGDAMALVPLVEGVVLVAESDRTSLAQLRSAGEQVQNVRGSVLAVLRNRSARYSVGGLGFAP